MLNNNKLTGFAASVTKAMGVPAPMHAEAPLAAVDALVKAFSKSGMADRVLCYNPDCLAFWLYQKYTDLFIPVMIRTQLTMPMRAVFPPVTPVNFGTMFTGAMPVVHGIRKYEKILIRIDTIFDALVRAGKKVALLVRTDSSMSKIFLERPIDYFIYDSDKEIEETGLRLIREDKYDFLLVYQMDYDDRIHETTPESEVSMSALKRHIRTFATLSDAVKEHWKKHDTLLAFAPDHGVHETVMGVGDHFADIDVDMNMVHFWAFQPAE